MIHLKRILLALLIACAPFVAMGAASPDQTRIGPPDPVPTITDAIGAQFSIHPGDNVVLRNGAATNGHATELLWYNGTLYAKSPTGGFWWKWLGINLWSVLTTVDPVPVVVVPPPPPSFTPGNLHMTATAVPYTGPCRALGASKHLDFARVDNRWYKIAGDHGLTADPLDRAIPPASDQGGRQEVLSFNVLANDCREDTPYYLPASYGVQGADPDDSAFSVVINNEIWISNSATNHGIAQPTGAAQQVPLLGNIGAYSPPSTQWALGHWRIVATAPTIFAGNRSWRGFFDPVKNRIVVPVTWGGSLVWSLLDATTGADLTAYTAGVPNTQGNHTFSVAGVACDFTKRLFYMLDVTTMELFVANMDTLAFSRIGVLPEPGVGTQSAIKIAWNPDLRAVVIAARKMYALEVDTGKLSTFDRLDGFTDPLGNYVPTSTIFFDPDSHDIVSVGTIDFADDTQVSSTYWRIRITPQ